MPLTFGMQDYHGLGSTRTAKETSSRAAKLGLGSRLSRLSVLERELILQPRAGMRNGSLSSLAGIFPPSQNWNFRQGGKRRLKTEFR